jgi:hypothetical protein
MRHFHLTRNQDRRPIINVDKLWSLVPEEQRKGLTEHSDIVPVIDTLRFGDRKVLGNGLSVSLSLSLSRLLSRAYCFPLVSSLPKLPCIVIREGAICIGKSKVCVFFYLGMCHRNR